MLDSAHIYKHTYTLYEEKTLELKLQMGNCRRDVLICDAGDLKIVSGMLITYRWLLCSFGVSFGIKVEKAIVAESGIKFSNYDHFNS